MVTPAGKSRWPRWLAQVVLGLTAVALVVGGLVAVNNAAREAIRPHERYLLRFTEIDCPAPPGQDRVDFLNEVQYIGLFPDTIDVLDPTLPDRLRSAFAAHRRVERVERIDLLPPNRIRVGLQFQD